MTRTVLLLSSLFVAACTVGKLPGNNGGDDDMPGPDASNGCMNRNATPDMAHEHGGVAGATNAGLGCVEGGCHLEGMTGTDAPAFQFAGTVYKMGATMPSPGAIVTITNAGGMTISTIADTAGNFHIPAGMLANPFPSNVNVSACPTINKMVSQMATTTGGGDCNGGGTCHGATAGKVYLSDP